MAEGHCSLWQHSIHLIAIKLEDVAGRRREAGGGWRVEREEGRESGMDEMAILRERGECNMMLLMAFLLPMERQMLKKVGHPR